MGLGRASALELAACGARMVACGRRREPLEETAAMAAGIEAEACDIHFDTDTLRTKYPRPIVEAVAGTVPLGRLGTEQEFGWLVAFLASAAGDYFSGAVLTLDGARGNWLGPWPPRGLAGESGKPLAEERRPER
jgi:NAD(P)-dependent dehydrogenase (short-subunit alcohol dehydrogenase family)